MGVAIRGGLLALGFAAACFAGFAIIALIADWVDLTIFGLLIVVTFLLVWGGALYDIWRRADLSSGSRIGWTAFVILLPILGTIVYAIARPAGADVTYTGEQVT
jgi:Phospholipase_D-nuclease N-terminal